MARLARAGGAPRLAEARLADAQARVGGVGDPAAERRDTAAAAETARAVAVSRARPAQDVGRSRPRRGPRQDAIRLAGTFAELSAAALAKNNEQFLTLADTKLNEARTAAQGDLAQRQQAIAQLLDPLSETLARYERGAAGRWKWNARAPTPR